MLDFLKRRTAASSSPITLKQLQDEFRKLANSTQGQVTEFCDDIASCRSTVVLQDRNFTDLARRLEDIRVKINVIEGVLTTILSRQNYSACQFRTQAQADLTVKNEPTKKHNKRVTKRRSNGRNH